MPYTHASIACWGEPLQVTLDKEPRFRAFDYEERHGQMLSRIGQRDRRHLCRMPLVRSRSLPRLWKKNGPR
jgi:hypothetical protein